MAEIGSNHDGSLTQAKKLVGLAKKAGADAIKFQTFLAAKIVSKEGFASLGRKLSFQASWKKSVYATYKAAEFPRNWHREIAHCCQEKEIDFFSSPYDKEGVDLLDELGVPAFKIGSGDINFPSHIKYIAGKEKPVIVGTGASTIEEIREAVNIIKSTGNENIVLLQCITAYPTPIEQANIRVMLTLRNTFQLPVGYSDHSLGIVVPLGAVALGACMIEKHFTLDNTRSGPDHPFALDVPQFTEMVEKIRLMEKALGSYIKEPVPAERETINLQRRSIYARENIPKGTQIGKSMLSILRPDKGIKPEYFPLLLRKKTRVNIKKGFPLTWDKIH